MPNPYAIKELQRLASRFSTSNPDDMGIPEPGGRGRDISLITPPVPPRPTPWPVGPPLVSRGGDMAPSLDQGVPSFSGASVLMSAPPGEQVSYEPASQAAPQAARTNLYTGGGNLRGNSAFGDVDAQRYMLNSQFADETRDRVIANQRAQAASYGMTDPVQAKRNAAYYGGEANALQNLLGGYEQDIEESPITAGIAADRDWRSAEQEAMNQGFTGGQREAARYARDIEKEKIEAPLKSAQATADANVKAQEIQSQGARDVADINAKSLAAQYAALQSALQGGNPDAIKGVTLPKGGGSISYQSTTQQHQPPIPATLMRDITTARTKLAQAGPTKNFLGMFPYGQTPEKIMYDQAVANGIAAYIAANPGSNDVADLASFVSGEPDLVGLTSDQILTNPKVQQHFDFTDMTPEEKAHLDQLLYVVRGMPGEGSPDSYFPSWITQ